MIPMRLVPERLKAAEADFTTARGEYDRAKDAFEAEATELANLRAKRDALSEAMTQATQEAEQHRTTWRDKIKAATAAYLAGGNGALSVELAEPRLSMKMSEARGEEHAAVLAELAGMIEAKQGKVEAVGNALLAAHRHAATAFARREALAAMAATIPALARAQAVVLACDVAGDDVAFARYAALPGDAPKPGVEEATGGLGVRYAVEGMIQGVLAA